MPRLVPRLAQGTPPPAPAERPVRVELRPAAAYRRRVGGRGTRAIDELARAGVPFAVREYEHDADRHGRGDGPGYGLEAAAALGVAPERIFKTLVAEVDGQLAAAIVPVAGELDLKALAALLAGRRATMARPADAERATGYVVGGISPLGQRRRLRTALDESALDHATILVSGGRRGLDVELAPADLARVTGATVGRLRAAGRDRPAG